MKTMKDLLQIKNPLINMSYVPDSDFKNDLAIVNNHLTNFINSEFGDLLLSNRILYNNEIDTSVVDTLIASLFYLNSENYTRQYQIVKALYVPTDNYNKVSTITTEHTGSETETSTKSGSEKSEYVNGTITNTTAHNGTETDTTSKSGSEKSEYVNGTVTNTVGAVEHSTTVKETVIDKSLVDKGNTIDNTGDQINTTEKGNDTKTTTYNNLTDTNEKSYTGNEINKTEKGNDTRTTTYNNLSNTNEKIYTDRKDIVTEHTTGNIGVTTSTAMLTEHNIFWSSFNFWLLIINDILKVLTKGVWNYEQ